MSEFDYQSEYTFEYDHDLAEEMIEEVVREQQRRLEYELMGAWRAGYDCLHIYDSPIVGTHDDELTIGLYTLPGLDGVEPPNPSELRYKYSYDLTDVDEGRLRRHWREFCRNNE